MKPDLTGLWFKTPLVPTGFETGHGADGAIAILHNANGNPSMVSLSNLEYYQPELVTDSAKKQHSDNSKLSSAIPAEVTERLKYLADKQPGKVEPWFVSAWQK